MYIKAINAQIIIYLRGHYNLLLSSFRVVHTLANNANES